MQALVVDLGFLGLLDKGMPLAFLVLFIRVSLVHWGWSGLELIGVPQAAMVLLTLYSLKVATGGSCSSASTCRMNQTL